MHRRVWFAVAVALLAALTVTGIGTMAYRAGVAQGLSEGARLGDAPAAQVPYAYWHGPYWGPGPFTFFFPVLAIVFGIVLLRGLFWAGRCGRYYGGWRGVPPGFEEWHRRAHEGTGDSRTA